MNIALKWTRPIQPIGGHVLKALRNISISHHQLQQEGTKADGDKISRRPPKTLAFKNVPAGRGSGDNEASKKAENISRAMAYYIKTKSERGQLYYSDTISLFDYNLNRHFFSILKII